MSKQPNDSQPNQWWLILLIAPFIGVLWIPIFNRIEPQLWGIPFFFWYQFLWVFISAVVTAFVYLKVAPRLRPIPRTRRKESQQ